MLYYRDSFNDHVNLGLVRRCARTCSERSWA
jgi:hypothetical protein